MPDDMVICVCMPDDMVIRVCMHDDMVIRVRMPDDMVIRRNECLFGNIRQYDYSNAIFTFCFVYRCHFS